MSPKKYVVNCPVCGKALFKSELQTGCVIDVQCAKCGSFLNVKHNQNMLSVKETTSEYTATAQKHI